MQSVERRKQYRKWTRRSLIICATLVQNPANLGGLCRSAEVFRLEQLVVGHASVMAQPAFVDLAVSAQYWQPLAIWSLTDLAAQFQVYQAQGYRVIALQQQANAHVLGQFTFPQQAILVLGRELTGIPDSVLQLVDDVVMIAQAGIIDSLNVQVAGAIAMYEYARQYPLSWP